MKLFLFIFLTFIVACQQEKEQPKFTLPTDKEIEDVIEDVIEAVIEQDSIQVSDRIPITIYLRKHSIIVQWDDDGQGIPPPLGSDAGETEYYNLLKNSDGMFSKQDSLYLHYQCENQRTFMLPSSFKYKYSIIEKTPLKWKDTINTTFIDFSVPIFTSDRKSAYVTITTHYGIGNFLAEYYYLNNINKKWIIVSKGELFRGCF